MGKTIFIHIGAHKTGTTAIQSFFALNRKILKKNGILYPGSDNAHHIVGWELKNIKDNGYILDENSNTMQIMWEIKKTDCPIIVLSSETFTESNIAAEVKNVIENILVESVEIKIIHYCRRQDHLLQSVYQERVKAAKSCETIREYLIQKDSHLMTAWNYWNKLKPWSENFDRDNIIVKIYEKDQFYNSNLISDFCNIIGLELTEDFQLPSKKQSNIGLDNDSIEIIRICNSASNNPELRRFLLLSLWEISQKNIGDPYTLLSPQERIALLEKFDSSNQKVAREYLGREDGNLFTEPWPDPDEPWEPYNGLKIKKSIQIFIQMMYNIDKRYDNPGKSVKNENIRGLDQSYIRRVKIWIRSIFF
jgi:hypothetical protein